MPEYLAPGVYIEEVPSGSKPIQGASTSTAGMVGVTARGPVNTPTLVTSLGNYARVFGSKLNGALYTAGRDALPYAAEGFFANGGSRLYVSRIVGDGARVASLPLSAATGPAGVLFGELAEDGTAIRASNAENLAVDDTVLIAGRNGSSIVAVTAAATAPRVTIQDGIPTDITAADTVTTYSVAGTAIVAAEAATADVTLTAEPDATPDFVLVGDLEDGVILTVSGMAAETLTLSAAPTNPIPEGAVITLLSTGATTTVATARPGALGAAHLDVADTAGIAAGQIIVVEAADVVRRLVTAITHSATVAAAPQTFEDGARIFPVVTAATVHAASVGNWGDSLRLTALPASLLATQTDALATAGSQTLSVDSAVGVYPGSFISIGGAEAVEVQAADAGDGFITLTTALAADVQPGTPVTTQEFSLRVELLDEDGLREEEEFFENLSLHVDHPRFAPTIIGAWPSGDASPSAAGASTLIRFETPVGTANRGRAVVVGIARMLDGGDDDIATIDDRAYMGESSEDPGDRTGIWALENEPTLSIVAVPGQTSVAVQKALVAHCEKMRYRFAVLDTPLGANLAAARTHRQNFDSTRCAIYYPGLSIADPFGGNGALRTIAPSGHMMGLYARTDNTRGVHKAPANEVVRNIMGFETKLTKGEQDILNPINLNCMRDFRSENRGLRCYGARVATSDPEWKYINVRRLLLYIEQSLDVGLQWAVFEPNDTPLWDTVRQSATNFLNTTWRSGALQGTTQEQAFFVDIGLGTTMTQDDIDNGRMIVRIGVAPVKPAEFVIARISQKTLEAAG